jgi:AcrR family transcriptional regulator
MSGQYMRIKELEHRSGVPRTTIHYYIREGLLHPPNKTSRTMAYYDESHLQRLEKIMHLKMNMRLPIDFIKRRIEEDEAPASQKDSKGQAPEKEPSADKMKDLRRQEIIKAGIKIFSTKGFHRTRVQDITGELDIATGTFYIYFKNKRDLFIEVVDDIIRRLLGDAAKAIKNEKDFTKRMELRARVFYDNYLRYTEILSQLRAEVADEDDWALKKVKNIYHKLTSPVIKEAKEAIASGYIRSIDPDLLAYAMTGLIEIMTLRSTVDNKYTYEDLFGFIKRLVSDGITANK